MPLKTDKYRVKDPFLDRRRKLIPCQEERIIQMWDDGYTADKLAKIFKVYKNRIYEIVKPEQYKKKTKLHRDKDQKALNVKAALKHRRYKKRFKDIFEKINATTHTEEISP